MKIEIELLSSIDCTIKIDGKVMTYHLIGNKAGLHPLTDDERDATLGGLVAGKLCDVLPDILQAWLPDEESPDDDCWETWEKLTDPVADQVYRAMA